MNPIDYCIMLCRRLNLHGREGAVKAVASFFREYPNQGCDADEVLIVDVVAQAI
jgi:hypothetical protein